MSEVHYFPRYSQRENGVTNNTLLLLFRFYQYNRLKFDKFMGDLCAEDDIELPSCSLRFSQQKGTGKSVVDGFIAQDSIKIAVETKLGAGFDIEQLKSHLRVFGEESHKILILLSPDRGALSGSGFKQISALAAPQRIQVLRTSFEEIVNIARSHLSDHDEEMRALVDDYEAFCSDWNLLPRDKYTLFVPPCSTSVEENIKYALYYCPATRSIRKTQYFGVYANKTIRAIGRIGNVVVCDIDLARGKVTVLETERREHVSKEEQERILGATIAAQKHEYDLRKGHKFYLCDSMEQTDFQKASLGGIMGHRYLDLEKDVLRGKVPDRLDQLAALLRRHTWQ